MKKYLYPVIAVLLFAFASSASQPAVWSVSTRSEILRGDARGVSIASDGSITLAPRFAEVFRTEQSYVWSNAVDSAGNIYLGTGGDGKIFKVTPGDAGTLFTDLTEMNVSALAFGRAGALFAATSPDGKVYRIDTSGRPEVYFDPKEKYVWSLALMSDGTLAVGTGENGRIYRVRSAGASPESSLLYDTSESHIISLAADKQGNLLAGTDPGGLVLRFGPDGKPFALLDSPLREIHEVALAADGSVYALALGESASSTAAAAGPADTKPAAAERPAATPAEPQKSRYELGGAKSAAYRITADGGVDVLWSSPNVTGFSLAVTPGREGVLIGTSDKGRIYSITNSGRETLLLQSDASQISTIGSTGGTVIATSSNAGKLFRLTEDGLSEGTYDSPVFDARTTAAWGRIWWNSSGNVDIQTRSGNSEKPDETWSSWSSLGSASKGGQVASPKSRFLQWRATLRRGGSAIPILSEVSVAYLPRNIAPEVLSVQVLPTNVGLLPNPPIQIDPNIELSGLDPALFGIANVLPPPRRAFQRGARAIQWTAEDRNGDKLLYDVFYRAVGDGSFKLLRENLAENFLTIDGQSLADGRYVIRVVAKDTRDNPAGTSGSGERISDPFDIDNTPPAVTVAASGSDALFTASDASSYISAAEYSINGGPWNPIYADDGIADSPNEKFTVRIADRGAGEFAVTLRAFDANGNSGNARVILKR